MIAWTWRGTCSWHFISGRSNYRTWLSGQVRVATILQGFPNMDVGMYSWYVLLLNVNKQGRIATSYRTLDLCVYRLLYTYRPNSHYSTLKSNTNCSIQPSSVARVTLEFQIGTIHHLNWRRKLIWKACLQTDRGSITIFWVKQIVTPMNVSVGARIML